MGSYFQHGGHNTDCDGKRNGIVVIKSIGELRGYRRIHLIEDFHFADAVKYFSDPRRVRRPRETDWGGSVCKLISDPSYHLEYVLNVVIE